MKIVTQQWWKQRWQCFRRKATSATASNDLEQVCTVVNLSGVALSEADVNLSSKGLSFCPTLLHSNIMEIIDDLESYFKLLHLREFFLDTQEGGEDNEADILFTCLSSWMPTKGREANLEMYTEEWAWPLRQLTELQVARSINYLSSEQKAALRNLDLLEDLIIKPADKGLHTGCIE